MFRRAFKTATVMAGLGLVAMAPTAFAVPVTWQVEGDLTAESIGTEFPGTFSFDLVFDTDGVAPDGTCPAANTCISFLNFLISGIDPVNIPDIIEFGGRTESLLRILVGTDGVTLGVYDPGEFIDTTAGIRSVDNWLLNFSVSDSSLWAPGANPLSPLGLGGGTFSLCSSRSATQDADGIWQGPCDFLALGTINSVTSVPEPATFGLLGFGLAGVLLAARRRRSGHPEGCPQA